jgi:hypothetical protein
MPVVVSSGDVVNALWCCHTPVYATSDRISEKGFSYRLYFEKLPSKPCGIIQ